MFHLLTMLLPTCKLQPSILQLNSMKQLALILLATTVLFFSACGTNKTSTAKEDSLSADAAADSMLKEALKTDSLKTDTGSL